MEQRNIRQYHHKKQTKTKQKNLELKMALLQQHIIEEDILDHIKQEEQKLQQSWEERTTQEEKLWQQKSRINWLKCGEKTPLSSTNR